VPRSNDRAEGRRNDGVKFPPSSSRKIGLYDLLATSEADIDMSGVEEIGQLSLKCVAGRYDESPLTSWVTAEAAEGAVGSAAVYSPA
jgi:hypothetical protein